MEKKSTPRVNYVIATYSGISPRRERFDAQASTTLQRHLRHLAKVLTTSTYIQQVTIVKPKVLSAPTYDNYYSIADSVEAIRNMDIAVVEQDVCPYQVSYPQFLEAYSSFPDFDYYILLEDDWVPHGDAKGFDKTLIDLFRERFPMNSGFLCAWAPQIFHNFRRHAAISSGIISGESLEALRNVLNDMKILDAFHGGQRAFSDMFNECNIPFVDYADEGRAYMIPNWNTELGVCLEYARFVSNKYLLVPVQLLEPAIYTYMIDHQGVVNCGTYKSEYGLYQSPRQATGASNYREVFVARDTGSALTKTGDVTKSQERRPQAKAAPRKTVIVSEADRRRSNIYKAIALRNNIILARRRRRVRKEGLGAQNHW
jgi:hypothetical protein